ncbi:MAG: SLC13 family permease, partial [Slackia sp.]
MDFSQLFAIAVFVVVMAAIMTEKVHRTLAALAGTAVLLIAHVMTFETAVSHIDYNTLGVLFGMMLFVA